MFTSVRSIRGPAWHFVRSCFFFFFFFLRWQVVSLSPNLKLEDHSLSAVTASAYSLHSLISLAQSIRSDVLAASVLSVEVYAAMKIQAEVFWVSTPCSVVVEGPCRLLQSYTTSQPSRPRLLVSIWPCVYSNEGLCLITEVELTEISAPD
jgi:hypothetical protein